MGDALAISALVAAAEVAAPAASDPALPEAVWRLPQDLREVVLLRFVNDLSYQGIALMLGRPLSAVRDRLYRARHALADFLK